MRSWHASLLLVLLFPSCAAKPRPATSTTTEAKMQMGTLQDIQRDLDTLMTKQLGFKAISCQTTTDEPGFIKQCFVSKQEPEALLEKIAQEMKSRGKQTVAWRQDVGYWVSTYLLHGPQEHDVLFSLIAPGVSSSMQADPQMKNEGTAAWYILGPHS